MQNSRTAFSANRYSNRTGAAASPTRPRHTLFPSYTVYAFESLRSRGWHSADRFYLFYCHVCLTNSFAYCAAYSKKNISPVVRVLRFAPHTHFLPHVESSRRTPFHAVLPRALNLCQYSFFCRPAAPGRSGRTFFICLVLFFLFFFKICLR